MSDLRETFRRRLKLARKMAGHTQASLAEAIDRSKDSVSAWERGIREIQLSDLALVARACNQHASWFFLDEKSKDPTQVVDPLATLDRVSELLARVKLALKDSAPAWTEMNEEVNGFAWTDDMVLALLEEQRRKGQPITRHDLDTFKSLKRADGWCPESGAHET